MVINFKRIILKNFMSFLDADIQLNKPGYTLVSGINENPDDSAKSNGSGKSSIWEGISWCLTGETIRGSKDIVNNYGNDGAYAELEFSMDDDEFRIIRTKDHSEYKTNLKIFINGEDRSGKGIRDTSKLLSDYLPDITSSLIGSVIILGQGLPQRFTNNSPAGRKEVLEKLSKSDFMIEDLKNRIANRKSELSDELRKCEDEVLSYKSKITLLQSQIRENQIKLESLNSNEELSIIIDELESNILDCQDKIDSFNQQIEDLRTKYREVADGKNVINSQIADISIEKTSIVSEKSAVESKIADENSVIQTKLANEKANIQTQFANEKANIQTQFTSEQSAIESKWTKVINEFYKNYTDASAELKTKRAELFKMQNIKDTCPTCGQKLPGVFKPDTSEVEKAIMSLENTSNDALNAYNKAKEDKQIEINALTPRYNEAIEVLTLRYNAEIEALTQKHTDELEQITVKYEGVLDDIRARLVGKDSEIETLKSKIIPIDVELNNITRDANDLKTSVSTYTERQVNYQARLDSAKKEKDSLESNRQTAQSIIDNNTTQITEIESLITEKESEQLVIKAHIDVVNKMSTVITRDFRGYLLMNVIDFINTKSKEYSQSVFGTDKIDFSIDGNNISISYDGKEYESLSGGEKQKVDLIVQFAIRDMLCKYLGFSSNILVLDEIADNVDSYGAERLFNLISTKLNDVESIYIVSHHVDFAMPMDNELVVTKGIDKISRIRQ